MEGSGEGAQGLHLREGEGGGGAEGGFGAAVGEGALVVEKGEGALLFVVDSFVAVVGFGCVFTWLLLLRLLATRARGLLRLDLRVGVADEGLQFVEKLLVARAFSFEEGVEPHALAELAPQVVDGVEAWAVGCGSWYSQVSNSVPYVNFVR